MYGALRRKGSIMVGEKIGKTKKDDQISSDIDALKQIANTFAVDSMLFFPR